MNDLEDVFSLKWHKRFMELAKHISTWSKDPSTKVGAVIIRPQDMSICSLGFNGFPQGMDDDPELYADREVKYSRVVHGEINALLLAHEPISSYLVYTYPGPPCDRCCVQLIQAKVSGFIWNKPTADYLSRWADSYKKTKSYIEEVGIPYLELE